MALTTTKFDTKTQLEEAFTANIVQILEKEIANKGQATLVVSGGSTPLALFKQLSLASIDWSKVVVTLADERWVDNSHDDSNEKLVRDNLLQNNAANANFFALKTQHARAEDAISDLESNIKAISTPFDVVILGMGGDGHTASLFPCSEQLSAGLDLNQTHTFIATQPTTAPHQRMSLTLKALIASKHVFLHLTGDEKLDVLNNALANATIFEKPIKAVCDNTNAELVWAP